jgi:hypothetical protein
VKSGKRGVAVTITGCINALGNLVPAVLIFAFDNFKNHMLIGASPGTHGTSHSSGW